MNSGRSVFTLRPLYYCGKVTLYSTVSTPTMPPR
jgi:hypothetical protein